MAAMSDATPDRSSLASALVRAARDRRTLSQRDLARAAGVPQSTVALVETGHRQPSVQMLERLLEAAGFKLETKLVNAVRPSVLLKRHQKEVAAALARHSVTRAWVFGSVATGTDGPESDLDLLVELSPDASFADYVGLDEELEAVLGCPVDIVTTRDLASNDLFRRRVEKQRQVLKAAA